MSAKLLAAFSFGVLLSAGVFYFVSRPHAQEPPVTSTPVPTEPEAPPAAVEIPAVPEPAPAPVRAARKPAATPRTFRPVHVTARTAPDPRPLALDAKLPDVSVRVESDLGSIAPAPLPPREPQRVTLPAGTLLQVRLGERLSSDSNALGDTFFATLDQPLVADGWVIAERGARVLGRVAEVAEAGRIKGVASMTLELAQITTSDGQKIPLRAAHFVRKGDSSRKADAAKVGIAAAIGAAIGAATGGGKGAGIGAASGGAAGAGAVLLTRGEPAVLAAETRLSFRLDQAVTITER